MTIIHPPRLRRGGVVGLVAPGSPPTSPSHVERGVRYLERQGYRVKVGRSVDARHGYLAGTDTDRSEDLMDMFRDPQVRAIISVRGGYGVGRLLPLLDYSLIRRNPKILVGYSDITALQLAVWRRCGLVTFSGPMAAVEMAGRMDAFTESWFWRLLTSSRPVGKLPTPSGEPMKCLRAGNATGRLLGGNLSLVTSLLGTRYSPDYRDTLLFFEEVGEPNYRVDRLITQLRNAGVLGQVKALALGKFTRRPVASREAPQLRLAEVWRELTAGVDMPMISGLPYGHVRVKLTLPLGVRAELDADRGRLKLLEGSVC